MKSYEKRPLKVFVSYLLVIALVLVLFMTKLSTNTEYITNAVLSDIDTTKGFGRARDKSEKFDPDFYNISTNDTLVPNDFKAVIQKDGQTLYYKEETAEIAFKNGENGSVWLSNPADYQGETLVGGESRDALLSQLTIGYFDKSGSKIYFDSYNACVKQGNVKYAVSDDKLQVSYYISKTRIEITDIPQQLSDKRFQEILARLDEKDAKEIKKYYQIHSLKGISSSNTKQMLIEQYKNIEENDIWAISTDTERILTKIYTILEKAGYTIDDLKKDNTENGINTDVEEKAYFDVTLIYSIQNGSLVVEIDTTNIKYASSFPIAEIRVLEFFGAAGVTDEGYILVPDGSGGLIHYNNGRSSATAFSGKVYGIDSSMKMVGNYQINEQILIPAFGMKTGDGAYVCLIQDGASLATINANVSGQIYSYNRAHASFDTAQSQSTTLSATSNDEIVLLEKNPYKGKFVLEYSFLENDNANYSGMAKAVRKRLLEKELLFKKEMPEKLPLDISYLGAVTVDKVILGISSNVQKSMTTFEQATQITNKLIEAESIPTGVTYIGWFNGGAAQQVVSKVKTEKILGGKNALLRFTETLSEKNIPLFNQVYFQTVYQTGNGFSKRADSPRNLSGDVSVGYYYDYMNRYKTSDLFYQISPNRLSSYVDRFTKSALKEGIIGINSADLGKVLGSDFSVSNSVTRPEAQNINTNALQTLSDNFELKLNSPNLYAWKYSDSITELPMEDSWFAIVNESVPFVQIVLSGLISYTGSPLNLEADYRNSLLEAIEYGSGFSYLLMHSDSAALKETKYNYYVTGKADNWLSIIAEDYKEANDKLSETVGKQITAHTRVDKELYKTDYENGVSVYVNYSEKDAEYQGIKIGAKDYTVIQY